MLCAAQICSDSVALDSGGNVMYETHYSLAPIGYLRSPLKDRGAAPRQGREGAPDAWLEVDAAVAEGLEGTCAIEARHCLLRVRNTTGVEVVKAAAYVATKVDRGQ
jgi:hypothetical protein